MNQPEKLIHDQLDNIQEKITTITEHDKDTRCHFRVAPSWGTITKDSFLMMDNHLKMLLAVTFRIIEKFVRDEGQDNLSWEKLLELMEQNAAIQRKTTTDMNVQQSKSKSEMNYFKVNGSSDEIERHGVIRWIRESIQDPELLKIIGEDAMLKIATIFSVTGSSVDSFCHFFANTENEEYTLLDVGIIRTPDISRPSLQLFRIKIYVQRRDTRVLFVQSDDSVLHLEANTRDYIPREEVMNSISEKVIEKAVEDLNKMFEDLIGK